MKWSSTVSLEKNPENSVRECIQTIRSELEGIQTDFVSLFVSPHFQKDYRRIQEMVLDRLEPKVLLGCSANGIIGGGKEVENRPAISLSCAQMPGVQMHSFRVMDDEIPDLDSSPKNWEKLLGVDRTNQPQFVLIADPFSIRIENFISGLDYAYPNSVKVGGLASGAQSPGGNALYIDGELQSSGLVGVGLWGNIRLDSLLAQGCRPIGPQLQVTACEENLLSGLDGQPPLVVLESIFDSLNPRDQELVQHSLFLGIAGDGAKENLGPGDFLIRNIMAADPKKGTLAIGNLLRVGQTVQFHLRDAQTSHDDLEEVLSNYSSRSSALIRKDPSSVGVLLFSCLGRGSYLYKVPNHDTDLFQKFVGQYPVSGFFCNGEVGPVGSTTYVHGYTSCFALFSAK